LRQHEEIEKEPYHVCPDFDTAQPVKVEKDSIVRSTLLKETYWKKTVILGDHSWQTEPNGLGCQHSLHNTSDLFRRKGR